MPRAASVRVSEPPLRFICDDLLCDGKSARKSRLTFTSRRRFLTPAAPARKPGAIAALQNRYVQVTICAEAEPQRWGAGCVRGDCMDGRIEVVEGDITKLAVDAIV